jgi:hypothetical protein
MDSVGSRTRRIAGWGTVAALTLHAALMYLVLYPRTDCDDKAVHYFSSAYVFASSAARQEVRAAMPAWLAQLPAAAETRFRTRMSTPHNYLASDTLIRALRIGRPPAWRGGEGTGYTSCVKGALFGLHVAALLCLAWLSRKHPQAACLLLITLALSSLRLIPLPLLAERPPKDMVPLIYVPRGSGTILAMSALVAVASQRYGLALIPAGLLALWHAAMAVVMLPLLALPAVAFHVAARRSGWRHRRELSIVALTVLLGLFLIATAGAAGAASMWASRGLVRGWPGAVYAAEIPMRLSGMRYWVAVAFVAGLLFSLAEAVPRRWPASGRLTRFGRAVLWAGLTLAAVAPLAGDYRRLAAGQANFFLQDCAGVTPVSLGTQGLPALDPNNEAVFFVSLAEHLLPDVPPAAGANGLPLEANPE